jgi:chromosomal replication initiator protein
MEHKTAQEIWEIALGQLQLQVNRSNYDTWLKKTNGISYKEERFVIGVPNTFVAEYLDKKQRSLIEKTLINILHHPSKIIFTVNNNQHGVQRLGVSENNGSNILFNPKYTFESFIVGDCNRLAYNAALKATESPGQAYNPLFIFGGVGLGKTHLLHAIGNAAQSTRMNVLYTTADQITNDFVYSVRKGKVEEFHKKYRSPEMLLIDDIHFLSGKDKTQESLCSIFNELHNNNRQIVVANNSNPKGIPKLQEGLRSRLEWGLTACIRAPSFDTSLDILRSKATLKGIDIALDALELIILQSQRNVRELEGALNRVSAYAKLVKSLATPEIASKALEDIADKVHVKTSVSPKRVIEMVASNFQLEPPELLGRKRDGNTVLARQVAMYLIRKETNCSLEDIGKEMGGRDHHVVSQACKKIAAYMTSDSGFRCTVLGIQNCIHKKA